MPTMEANCPIQNMNIHLMISAFALAISSFVATFPNKVSLFVSKAVSTASAIVVACFSSKLNAMFQRLLACWYTPFIVTYNPIKDAASLNIS